MQKVVIGHLKRATGPWMYVACSRTRKLADLFFLRDVSEKDLEKCKPNHDMLREMNDLQLLDVLTSEWLADPAKPRRKRLTAAEITGRVKDPKLFERRKQRQTRAWLGIERELRLWQNQERTAVIEAGMMDTRTCDEEQLAMELQRETKHGDLNKTADVDSDEEELATELSKSRE